MFMTITGVQLDTLYTVTLQAINGNIRSQPTIIYAYPTRTTPSLNTKIDTITLVGHLDTIEDAIGHYRYTLCSNVLELNSDTDALVTRTITDTESASVEAGFRKWVSTTGMVSFHQNVSDCTDGTPSQNWILLVPFRMLSSLCDGPAYGCAKIRRADNGKIIRVYIYMDSNININSKCSQLSHLVAHEAGHVFGLDHSSDANKSVMFGDFKDLKQCSPTEYDIVALKAIYQSIVPAHH